MPQQLFAMQHQGNEKDGPLFAMQGMRCRIVQVDEVARPQRLGFIVTTEIHFAS